MACHCRSWQVCHADTLFQFFKQYVLLNFLATTSTVLIGTSTLSGRQTRAYWSSPWVVTHGDPLECQVQCSGYLASAPKLQPVHHWLSAVGALEQSCIFDQDPQACIGRAEFLKSTQTIDATRGGPHFPENTTLWPAPYDVEYGFSELPSARQP